MLPWLKVHDGSLQGAQGLDNLLYSADADFSCFADLALTSPEEYYREGQGSLMQCVLTPADPYMPMPNEEIAAKVHQQVRELFLLSTPPPLAQCLLTPSLIAALDPINVP